MLGGDEGLTVEIRGYDLATLDALARRVAALIKEVPGVTDLDTSLEAGIPQQDIRVDRDKVADLGLSIRDVTELLQTAVAGSKAGEFRQEGHSYRILVQLKDAEQRSLDEILDLTLTTDSGEKVALRNVVATEASRGPVLIERKDQQRQVTVPPMSPDAIWVRWPRRAGPAGWDSAPRGLRPDRGRQVRGTAESLPGAGVSLLLALVLVYMVLACQYESLRDPLVVMFSVPLAASSGCW
jgi:HAE1 family hydrophobic/amphiphilic exporter-1